MSGREAQRDDGAGSVICPQCQAILAEHRIGGVDVDLCSNCEGAWFDAGELEAYRASTGGSTVSVDRTFKIVPGLESRSCPRCQANTLESGSLRERTIHRCAGCSGVFVSRRELAKVSDMAESHPGDQVPDAIYVALEFLSFLGDC